MLKLNLFLLLLENQIRDNGFEHRTVGQLFN
jgi:hypothetical protein